MQKQRCPRRDESANPDGYGDGTDTPDLWASRRGRTACSYCGSLHPDAFMEIARTGAQELGPTDKNYKVYVGGANAGDGGKFYLQHLTANQRREFVDLYNARPRRVYADDMTFTQSDGTGMLIGYPGYLYSGAFFMGSVKA